MSILKVLFILFLINQGSMSFYSLQQCDCEQILNQKDCLQFTSSCQWDSTKLVCTDNTIDQQQQLIATSRFCSQFSTQKDCLNKENKNGCQWYNSQCSHFTGCSIIEESTNEKCQGLSPLCITNGEYCVDLQYNCKNYAQKETCHQTTNGYYCYWNDEDKSCTKAEKCDQLPKILNTDQLCTSAINTCTTTEDGGCVERGITCPDRKQEIQCFSEHDFGIHCFWHANSCYAKNCEGAPNTYLTDQECQDFLPYCTTKENGGCTDRRNCKDATIEAACKFDQWKQKCFWDGTKCVDNLYQKAPSSFTTDEECKKILPTCITQKNGGCADNICGNIEFENLCTKDSDDNECFWIYGECQYKQCYYAPNTYMTTQECQQFLNEKNCLVNKNGGCNSAYNCQEIQTQSDCTIDYHNDTCYWQEANDKCGYLENACQGFVLKQQCQDFSQVKCIWIGNCVQRECVYAPKTNMTFQECQKYKSNCTRNPEGGCQDIPLTCSANESQQACLVRGHYVDNGFQTFQCVWTNDGCLDADTEKCEDAPLTIDSQFGCHQYSSNCILNNPVNGQSQGCMNIPKDCSELKIKNNCKIYKNITYCLWDSENQVCQELTCNLTLKAKESETQITYQASYQNCGTYFDNCIPNNDFTNCFERPQDCSELSEYNCVITGININQNKEPCEWKGEKCQNKSCSTGTSNYSTHADCNQYLSSCTVNSNLSGCMELPNTCEEIKLSQQCKLIKSGDQCIWLDEGRCVQRNCEIASPDYISSMTFITDEDCQNFLPSCSALPIKCQAIQCEHYKFTTIAECKNAKSDCTTDGVKCVLQGNYCSDQKIQEGCTVNYWGQECAWVAFSNPPYCTNKDCSTAPLSLKTEVECQQYFSQNCTNKLNGGCQQMNYECRYYTQQDTCTNIKGQKCQWDVWYCKDKIFACDDFLGTSHQQCYSQLSSCTFGVDGKCVKMIYCNAIKNETECFVGLDGPCLWIPTFINSDKTKGACFTYTSCSSFSWDKDELCKIVSPQCTTDGHYCVSISKCERNNIKGGCVTGTDGDCIQIDSQCKKFSSCSQAQYSSHEECQNASKKCTTDGQNCIELKALCSDYQNYESCKLNQVGQINQNSKVISTGKCVWKSGKCQDQDCDSFSTEDCQSALSHCILIDYLCFSSYNFCEKINKLDCKNSKFSACIYKDSDYSCKQMQSCSDASESQTICQANKNKCNWVPKNGTTENKCVEHTCDTYFQANSICQIFQSFDGKLQQYCQLDSKGICQNFDPKNYTEAECSIETDFTFRWDKKCLSCEQIILKLRIYYMTSAMNIEISSSSYQIVGVLLLIFVII